MQVINGVVKFESNEKDIWEKLLERTLDTITPHVLRELGEARVKELQDEDNHMWARMAAQHVADIPNILH